MPGMIPPGWASDSLSKYLDDVYKNRWASFHNKRPDFSKLLAIDDIFLAIIQGWKDPTNVVEAMLFILSHGSFRGCCEHALGGQIGITFPLARSCLEYASYALHMQRNAGHSDIWLNRHTDEASAKKLRAEFTYAKLLATVKATDSKLAVGFAHLYERCIDFGAHPNELAMSSSMFISGEVGQRIVGQLQVQGDGVQMWSTL